MKRCFFIGHRETGEEVLPLLRQEVERHIIEYRVEEFVVGNYGGFDRMAAKAVAEAKERYPHITLSLLLPYHPAERKVALPAPFDDSFYPEGLETVPRRFAIVQANRRMIGCSDYLIAYVWHPASNAQKILAYAQRQAQRGEITVTVLPRCEK